jgi:hypothetical protein
MMISFITVIQPTDTTYASNIDCINIPMYSTINTLLDADTNVSCTFETEHSYEEYEVAVRLSRMSLVVLSVNFGNTDSNHGSAQLYTDKACTKKVFDSTLGSTGSAYEILDAGTYYLKIWTDADSYLKNASTVNAVIGALPLNRVLGYTTEISDDGKTGTVTFRNYVGEYIHEVDIADSAINSQYASESKYWGSQLWVSTKKPSGTTLLTFDNNDKATYTFTKNGTYTIRIVTKEYTTSIDAISYQVEFNGIDETAPKVTGVKNGKTYTKAVTIKASDSGSGLKSATLNKTKVKISKLKNGYKVSKNGKYTLKVTDKAGNTKTIKFTIKKK